MPWLGLALLLLAFPVAAETLVAARTIRSQALIGPQDVVVLAGEMAGSLTRPEEAVGLEARVTLYAGRPIQHGQVGPPALVQRNQTVVLIFRRGALSILAEGRSLGRGSAGEVIKVMNVTSRSTVSGVIGADGQVRVLGGDKG